MGKEESSQKKENKLKALIKDLPEVKFALVIFLAVIVLILILDKFLSDKNGFLGNILSEVYGLSFDILVFGIMIVIFNKIAENRRQIKRYHEEIDDYRHWDEKEAGFRIAGIIRRLNKKKVTSINLSGCYLKERNLSGIYLIGANITGANLEGADLKEANLQGANLEAARLSKADLSRANLRETNLTEAFLEDANFYEADLQKAYNRGWGTVIFRGAEFELANLQEVHFDEASFRNANLNQANLQGASLRSCYFEGADLSYANLKKSILTGTSFIKSNLDSANLQGADMKSYYKERSHGGPIHEITKLCESNLEKANLRGVNFHEVDLTGVSLIEADLRGAKNLTIEQLSKIKTLYKAKLDLELEHKVREKYIYLLEKPKE